jgi:hypothetical protein
VPIDTPFVQAAGTVHAIPDGATNQTITIVNNNPSVFSDFFNTQTDSTVTIVFRASNGDVYIGGDFLNVNNLFAPRIARFRNGAWERIFPTSGPLAGLAGFNSPPLIIAEDS